MILCDISGMFSRRLRVNVAEGCHGAIHGHVYVVDGRKVIIDLMRRLWYPVTALYAL